eukprot:gene672-8173_t
MSKNIQTPVNQQRTTNIVVVRLKKAGIRFEIACYPNKVMQYRQNIETELSEVLQTESVFYNVSKGTFAKKEDLKTAFGSLTDKEICELIIKKGELQISPKERQLVYDSLYKDISTIVVNKCINPDTKTPYTATQIEREMKDMNFKVNPNKSAKVQALDLIKKLKDRINIERANMRIEVNTKKQSEKMLKKFFEENQISIEKKEEELELQSYLVLIDPGVFRDLDKFVTSVLGGKVNIQDSCVTKIGDIQIDKVDMKENDKTDDKIQEEEEEEEDSKKSKKKKETKIQEKKNSSDEELAELEKLSKKKKKKKNKKEIQYQDEEEKELVELPKFSDSDEEDGKRRKKKGKKKK